MLQKLLISNHGLLCNEKHNSDVPLLTGEYDSSHLLLWMEVVYWKRINEKDIDASKDWACTYLLVKNFRINANVRANKTFLNAAMFGILEEDMYLSCLLIRIYDSSC